MKHNAEFVEQHPSDNFYFTLCRFSHVSPHENLRSYQRAENEEKNEADLNGFCRGSGEMQPDKCFPERCL